MPGSDMPTDVPADDKTNTRMYTQPTTGSTSEGWGSFLVSVLQNHVRVMDNMWSYSAEQRWVEGWDIFLGDEETTELDTSQQLRCMKIRTLQHGKDTTSQRTRLLRTIQTLGLHRHLMAHMNHEALGRLVAANSQHMAVTC